MSETSRIALFFIVTAALVWVLASNAPIIDAQSTQDDGLDYHPVNFQWFTKIGVEQPNEFLILEYEDGRRLVFRGSALMMARFYPAGVVSGFGIDAPHIFLTVAGKDHRIDLTTNDEADALFKELFPDENEKVKGNERPK